MLLNPLFYWCTTTAVILFQPSNMLLLSLCLFFLPMQFWVQKLVCLYFLLCIPPVLFSSSPGIKMLCKGWTHTNIQKRKIAVKGVCIWRKASTWRGPKCVVFFFFQQSHLHFFFKGEAWTRLQIKAHKISVPCFCQNFQKGWQRTRWGNSVILCSR